MRRVGPRRERVSAISARALDVLSPNLLTNAATLLLLASTAVSRAAEEGRSHQTDRKPNIVLILADNVGYGELGVYGGGILRGAPTPRIDQLAS